ncbi:hypothetical protein K474DRAFT_1657421 [Panus rudis PR-1116 ss-1]|nr:hypothetical protein K474DRAFT_1657421 [Panus rudis PR-1116 ss-1]
MFSVAEKTMLAVSLLTCLTLVLAVPAFEGMTAYSSIGNLVPGLTFLEGIGPQGAGGDNYNPLYVSIQAPRGSPGNATLLRNPSPPLFYVYNDQLWHYHNDSTILPVRVMNSTLTAQLPLQVIVGEPETKQQKKLLVKGGKWRWQGTILRYDQGEHSNPLFFSCQDTNGLSGLFLHAEP